MKALRSLIAACFASLAGSAGAGECQQVIIPAAAQVKNGMAEANLPPFGTVCVVVQHPERAQTTATTSAYDNNAVRIDLYRTGERLYTLPAIKGYEWMLTTWLGVDLMRFPQLGPRRETGIIIFPRYLGRRDEVTTTIVYYRDGNGYRGSSDLQDIVVNAARGPEPDNLTKTPEELDRLILPKVIRKTNRYLAQQRQKPATD
jgi:hypothetical protein